MPTRSIWTDVRAAIKTRIPEHSFRMWLEPLEFKSFEDSRLVVSSPNFFSKRRVLEHYGPLIEKEVRRLTGGGCRLIVEIGNGNGSTPPQPGGDRQFQLALPEINVRPHNGRLLRRDFTFDHFVVGGSNDFAYSACLSLACSRRSQQNSLYLLSKTGLGKSHLAQAIGHHILKEFPGEKVYYITAEDFTAEMIQSFRHGSFEDFKKKYRDGCDVLLIEDIHHLSGKDRTQVELASTLDSLFEANKKIIFSSCCLPSEIPKLSDKLRSRLGFGLISTIDPPDFRTRVRILKKKASVRGAHIPDDIYEYLASELTEDVRQLESGLIGVTAKSSLLGVEIDLPLAESIVQNIVQVRKSITVDAIKKLVCREYRIPLRDITSKSRKQSLVRPRQVAIFLSRRYTDAPLQTIGKSFNRYHATVLHSINAVEKELPKNHALKKQIDFLSRKLESGDF